MEKAANKLRTKDIQMFPMGGKNSLKVKYKDWKEEFTVNGFIGDRVSLTGDWSRMYNYNQTDNNISIEDVKPILRPMSDLYKPCLPDGEVPIVELFKLLCTPDDPFESFETILMIDYLEIDNGYMFFYDNEGAFRYRDESFDGFIPCQLELFQKLYEWHFDINNLREKDLCIYYNEI